MTMRIVPGHLSRLFLQDSRPDPESALGNANSLMVAVGLVRKDRFTPEQEKSAIEIARRLLELGADINEANAVGWTALHAATFIGADALVEFLVKNGANINAKNGGGRTPHSLAEGENDVGLLARPKPKDSTVAMLKKLGADKSSNTKPAGECILGRYQYEE